MRSTCVPRIRLRPWFGFERSALKTGSPVEHHFESVTFSKELQRVAGQLMPLFMQFSWTGWMPASRNILTTSFVAGENFGGCRFRVVLRFEAHEADVFRAPPAARGGSTADFRHGDPNGSVTFFQSSPPSRCTKPLMPSAFSVFFSSTTMKAASGMA